MTIKKISVFCGAHVGKSPNYKTAAEQTGMLIAEKGLEVIFGGGNVGLMKIVADTAIKHTNILFYQVRVPLKGSHQEKM